MVRKIKMWKFRVTQACLVYEGSPLLFFYVTAPLCIEWRGGKNENASSVYIVCCVLCGGGVDGGVLPRRRRRRLLRYPNPISSSLAPSASSPPPPPSRRLTIESRAPRAVHRRSAVTGSIIEQTNRNDQLGNRTVLEDLST